MVQAVRRSLLESGIDQTLQELSVSFNVPDADMAIEALQDIIENFPSLTKLRVGLYLESSPDARLTWEVVEVSFILPVRKCGLRTTLYRGSL